MLYLLYKSNNIAYNICLQSGHVQNIAPHTYEYTEITDENIL